MNDPIGLIQRKGQYHLFNMAELTTEGEDDCGLRMSFSSDDLEYCEIVYRPAAQRLVVRMSAALAEGFPIPSNLDISHSLDASESLQLRILLDASVLEIIANCRTSISCRLYPETAGAVSIYRVGAADFTLNVWEMQSIWE